MSFTLCRQIDYAAPCAAFYRNACARASCVARLRSYSYNLVLYKHGEQLYVSVFETIAGHLASERAKLTVMSDEMLLAGLRSAYERHTLNMDKIKDVLMYLVRCLTTSEHVRARGHSLQLSLIQMHD